MDDDRLEGLRRREDEAPRERQATGARGAPPARSAGPASVTAAGVTPSGSAWRSIAASRSSAACARSQRSTIGGVRPTVAGDAMDDELPGVGEMDDVRPADAADRGHDPDVVQLAAERHEPPSRAPPRASSVASRSACRARCRRTHGFALAQELRGAVLAVEAVRAAAGTVTRTPRCGSMTTRSVRARVERRSVYGSGPPGRWTTVARSSAGHDRSAGVAQEPPGAVAGLDAVADRRAGR